MRQNYKHYILSAAFFLGGLNVWSSTQAQTIQDAVQAAIINHPQVEQAKARYGIAEEEEKSVKSGLYPTLSVGLTAGRVYGENATSRGTVTTRGAAYSGLGEATATLQQPIFDGYETINRLKASRASIESANLQLQDVREQIAYQTVQAYINVLQARSILIRLQNQEAKVNDYLERIEANVEDGGADEAQLQQAKDVRVLLNGFVADYTAQLRTTESQFMELTGVGPFEDMKVPSYTANGIPENLEEAVSLASIDHPAIKAVAEDAKASGFDAEAERGFLYPEVVGELSYLKNDKREEIGGEVEDRRAVLRLNWEFEAGQGQHARIKQRQHEESEARARESEIRRQIERDIRIAYANRDAAKKRLKNQKERVSLNKKLFETYEAQFEGGRVDLLQLMQADNQLFNTEVEKTVYQYRLLSSQYGVVASLGQLQETLFQAAAIENYQDKAAADEPPE